MKSWIFLFALLGLMACESKQKTYEQTKTSLSNQEEDSPLHFLSLKGEWHRNLVGQWVFEGTLTNSATLVKYKEPILELKYYGEGGKKLGSETVTLDEQINPKQDVSIKVKQQGYKGTKKVTATLVKVSVVK